MLPVLTWLEVGMKTEKSPSTHVWNRKICLKHRVVFPFASADSYDPRQVCEHTRGLSESFRKFSRDLQQ